LVQRLRPDECVLMADGDQPGLRGARQHASSLLPHVRTVRLIVPPVGTKDARAWLNAGATADDVNCRIDDAPAVRIRMAREVMGA
jgi:hypothetical protein